MSTEARSTELDGQPVVMVAARDREPAYRCDAAPHDLEVIVYRPSDPYHRLVFTPAEWAAIVADVKAGAFDLVES
jgi:hypothetical protein